MSDARRSRKKVRKEGACALASSRELAASLGVKSPRGIARNASMISGV